MSALAKARAAHGEAMPDHIRALAEACAASGLRKTAKRIGVSPALISLALAGKRGKEQSELLRGKVETYLLAAMIPCPVLGLIDGKQCLQEQTAPFSAANPLSINLYKACRNGCRYFGKHKGK